jgi:hypothetical protein
LLELGLRLGEGSGAALAVPLMRLACASARADGDVCRSRRGRSPGMSLHLDLLRHGETELGGGLRGSLDDALTALGWAQMRDAVWRGGPWDRIVSSPLQRCALFAWELSAHADTPVLRTRTCKNCTSAPGKGRARSAIDGNR